MSAINFSAKNTILLFVITKFMKDRVVSMLVFLVLLFGITSFLDAQEDEPRFIRRLVWGPAEYVWRYEVEVNKLEGGSYRNFLKEFTTSTFIEISLPPGEFRFRIIPYDILGRPAEGTQWVNFVVRMPPPVITDTSASAGDSSAVKPEHIEIINFTELTEGMANRTEGDTAVILKDDHVSGEDQAEKNITRRGDAAKFNTLGISLGSSFVDPLMIASIHGTISPVRNLFFEFGFEYGFISTIKEVENYYCLYPFARIGSFIPFKGKGGIFICAGGGYISGNYTFQEGAMDLKFWAADFSAGINLFDLLNLSYTIKTDFNSVSNKVAIGYVFRFR